MGRIKLMKKNVMDYETKYYRLNLTIMTGKMYLDEL